MACHLWWVWTPPIWDNYCFQLHWWACSFGTVVFSIFYHFLPITDPLPHWCDFLCEALCLLAHNTCLCWTLYQLLHWTGFTCLMDRWPMDLAASFPFLVTQCTLSQANQWWTLLIQYCHIPIYFHFSITFSTSLIHHADTTSHMSLCDASPSLDQLHLFDGQMIYHSHVIFPFLVTWHTPTVAQPIMSCHTAWSGIYCSFTSDEPCAHFLDYHSYLTHLYLRFFDIQVSPRVQT